MASQPTLLPPEASKIAAESVGIISLSDDVATLLCHEVEYRLREITQDALKFMKHSKREKIVTDDINSALGLRNLDILFGYGSRDLMPFVRANGHKDLFFTKDSEYSLDKIIAKIELPPLPNPLSYSVHWLAVDGIQPNIPQNPSKAMKSLQFTKQEVKTQSLICEDLEVKPSMRHIISKELQELYEKITEAILNPDLVEYKAALEGLSQDPGLHQLLPYFCQFLTKQVAEKVHDLQTLVSMMQVTHSLLVNPNIHLGNYLHQIIPVILTCLVGKRLCSSPVEDHWSLRDFAADLLAHICHKWGAEYNTILPRIIKALARVFFDLKKPLTSHYGAIVALDRFGMKTIKMILLPNLDRYFKHLNRILEGDLIKKCANNNNNGSKKEFSGFKSDKGYSNLNQRHEAQMCYQALLSTCGHYLYGSSKLYDGTERILLNCAKKSMKKASSSDTETILKSIELQGELLPLSQQYSRLYDIFGESLFPYVTQRNPYDLASVLTI